MQLLNSVAVPKNLIAFLAMKISKQSSNEVIMNYLKANLEQIDIVPAVTFVADYCFHGAGTLILDGYYRHVKFGSRKFWIIWDIVKIAVFLTLVIYDNSTDLGPYEPVTKDYVQILFCLKYVEFFWKARIYNSIHKRKYCSVCLNKPKQQIANTNSFIFKYCICVCRKCERFTSDCDACKFTISTHFR